MKFERTYSSMTLVGILFVLSGSFAAFGKEKPTIDHLFKKGATMSVKELSRAAQKIPQERRSIYYAAGLELFGHRAELISFLEPKIANNRQQANANVAMTCMLVYAYVQSGKPDLAGKTLALLREVSDDDLTHADLHVVTGHWQLARSQQAAARKSLALAQKRFKRAVPRPEYVTWHSRLVDRRLKALHQALKKPRKKPDGDPHVLAWLKADKKGTADAYAVVVKACPDTVYADAAQLAIASLHLNHGDAAACLKTLEESPALFKGPLGELAWIMKGDAMVLAGERPRDAGKAYDQAIAALRTSERPTIKLDDKVKRILLPNTPLHAFEGGYPKWLKRKRGQILMASQDANLRAYHRYRTVVKRSALAYAEGKKTSAAALARSLLMFDPVDRKMAQDKEGPGGLILERTWKTDQFLCSLAELKHAPARLRNPILMGVAFYQVYDWETANWWFAQALKAAASSRKDRFVQQFVTAVSAYNLNVLGRSDEAMKLVKTIVLKPGEPVKSPWILARRLESKLYMNGEPTKVDAALAALQEVVRRAPKGHPKAMQALMSQCTIATHYKPSAADGYIQEFQKRWPKETQILTSLKYNLQQKRKQK